MLRTIEQSVQFPVPASELFDIYIDPVRHAEFTGAAVQISSDPGSWFSAFDGMLAGVTLCAVPGKLIVQRWRSCEFKPADADSVLVLTFVEEGQHSRIDMVHANVPEHDYDGVTQGWEKYYWRPLRAYLKGQLAGK